MKRATGKKPQALPPNVLAVDLSYPDFQKDPMVHDVGQHGMLTFYKTDSIGWCVMTLDISRGRGNNADRKYGIRVAGGGVVRVGNGPHVKEQVTIYVRKSRAAALKKYTDLYTEGLTRAGEIRDRISSRRAQGQEMRAQGRHSWRWDL